MRRDDWDDDWDFELGYDCPDCGAELVWVRCWQCHGEGGFHDCGEDCCCCLDKEEITAECDVCHGEGKYLQCCALPHHKSVKAEP
jgi:hypothetical protein